MPMPSLTPQSAPLTPLAQAARAALLGAAALAAVPAALTSAHAQEAVQAATAAATDTAVAQSFAIPPGPLAHTISRFAAEAGVQLSVDASLTAQLNSPGLQGRHSTASGFAALLAGTGLVAVQRGNGYTLQKAPAAPQPARDGQSGAGATLPTVTVAAQAARAGDLPEAYAGGQVARGGRVGLLGNRDFMETPFSITSYTSQLIEDQQADTLQDVLKNDPAVGQTQPAGGSMSGVFNIRGISSHTNASTFDGLFGMMPWWGAFPTDFVERVEVFKGPSAMLNGMPPGGTVGGTVNLVPKRARDEPLARLTLGLESDALWRGHVDVGRRFGADGEWGLRFNGSYTGGDGHIDGLKHRGNVGALALDYRGKQVRLTLDAFRFQQKMHGGNALIALTTAGQTSMPAAPDGKTNILPGAPESSATTETLTFGGAYDFNDRWTGYAKLGASRDDISAMWSANMTPRVDGAGSLSVIAWPTKRSTRTGEVGLRGHFQTGSVSHAIAISASYLSQDVYSYRVFHTPQPSDIYAPAAIVSWPTTPATLPKSGDNTFRGLALADTLGFLNDRVLLTLGVRQQQVKQATINPSGAVTSNYDESAWSPMAGVVVKPTDELSLYANYIQGLSAGTIVGTRFRNAQEVFPPYKTKQIEVGAKLQTGRLTNTVSVFQIVKPSVLADNSTTPPTAVLDGEQRNRGIEWTAFGELTRGLRVLGGVTYLQGRLTKTQDGLYNGNQAPGSTPWVINLGADWDVSHVPGLALSSRVVYNSRQYVEEANAVKIPAWTRFDAGARYTTRLGGKNVVLRANVDNLFDRNYWQGISSTGGGYVILGAPRTFRLSATFDF